MPYIPPSLPMANEGRLAEPPPVPAHPSHNFDFMGNCNKCRAVEGVASGAAVCAETMPHTEAQMARKFIVGSYHNTHVVYEIVRGGERAVSPSYSSKEAAHSALVLLQQNQAADHPGGSPTRGQAPSLAAAAASAMVHVRA